MKVIEQIKNKYNGAMKSNRGNGLLIHKDDYELMLELIENCYVMFNPVEPCDKIPALKFLKKVGLIKK